MSDGAAPSRPWRAAAAWCAACGALFAVVYNACNWFTAQRSDVGTWYADWELSIPLVPWMIVPYWSLDALFVAGFFVAATGAEVTRLGRRIALAILVASAGFLLVPLQPGFVREPVPGWPGPWFDALRSFDAPHNLFPSLHVALRTILAEHFSRHTRGALWWATHAWFSLIGFSTVFTHQHHVVDVIGGFALGAVCVHAFAPPGETAEPARNAFVARLYGAGAVVCVALAAVFGRAGMLWLWPALALGLLAGANAGWGAAVFRKRDGRVPFSSRIVLAPVLAGQWLSWLWYTRRCDPWNEVAPGVWIGRRLTSREAEGVVAHGVTAVLDLTAESSESAAFRGVAYRNVPVLDLTAPSPRQLGACAAFIAEHSRAGVVYVHCKIGWSRSAAAVGAHLLASGAARSADEAMSILRRARPGIVIRAEIEAALRDWKPGTAQTAATFTQWIGGSES